MYKVFTPIISITLAAGAILFLSNIGLFFVPFDTVPAQVVSHLALSTLALIIMFGIGTKAIERYQIKKKIVRRLDNILIADLTSDGSGTKFAYSYDVTPKFGFMLETKLRVAADDSGMVVPAEITTKSLNPYTLVLIRDKGDVNFSYHGTKLRAKGLSSGNQCEIESLNLPSTYSLMEHEVGHMMLKNTKLGRSSYKHHLLMRKAGF